MVQVAETIKSARCRKTVGHHEEGVDEGQEGLEQGPFCTDAKRPSVRGGAAEGEWCQHIAYSFATADEIRGLGLRGELTATTMLLGDRYFEEVETTKAAKLKAKLNRSVHDITFRVSGFIKPGVSTRPRKKAGRSCTSLLGSCSSSRL